MQLHDGSWITLKALNHEEHDVTDKVSALRLLEESQQKNEFLTGLIYVDAKRRDFVTMQNMVRHAAGALARRDAAAVGRRAQEDHGDDLTGLRPEARNPKFQIRNLVRIFVENRRSSTRVWLMSLTCVFLGASTARLTAAQEAGPPLPGTKPLTMTGDITSELVAGVDRFLLKQIDESAAKREKYWKRDFSSPAAYQASVEPNRKRLAHILGVRDARVPAEKQSYRTDLVDPSAEFRGSWALLDPFGDLVGLRGCDWRRTRPGSERGIALGLRRHRDPGRGPDTRAACRPGRGRSARITSGAPVGRETGIT